MSANLDLVRSIYAVWERGDFTSARLAPASKWAYPEIEYVIADGPSPGRWAGVTGMTEGWREFVSAWENLHAEADAYREPDNERILVFATVQGRGKTSGLELGRTRATLAHLFHVRAGKVTKLVLYFDRESALADLGLAPEGDPR
jgi:ketosteroid isomerase-like protein